jgi:hypothetical protein
VCVCSVGPDRARPGRAAGLYACMHACMYACMHVFAVLKASHSCCCRHLCCCCLCCFFLPAPQQEKFSKGVAPNLEASWRAKQEGLDLSKQFGWVKDLLSQPGPPAPQTTAPLDRQLEFMITGWKQTRCMLPYRCVVCVCGGGEVCVCGCACVCRGGGVGRVLRVIGMGAGGSEGSGVHAGRSRHDACCLTGVCVGGGRLAWRFIC